MRVLLVVNIVLPKVAHLINRESAVTGGWLSEIIEGVSKKENIKLAVATPYEGNDLKHFSVDNVDYYFLPRRNLYDVFDDDCHKIFDSFQPDLLHIEGSEFKHANTFINCWDGENVLSLQGIVNGIEPYYFGGLSIKKLLFSFKIPELFAAISLLIKKRVFRSRLIWEQDTIGKAKNLLGRTNWDLAHARKFNLNANYYKANRILRDPFYNNEWDISNAEKYSIYIGNSYQPIKGFHFVIEAVHKLKKKYPKIKIYVAGISPYDNKVKRNIIKNGYAYYLRKMIERNSLDQNFIFLGSINAEEVASKLRKVHVYCLASAIENSPNTLGEAMLLGVPSVASFVGGVSDMASDNHEALLYRYDEVDVLVNQISRIFDDDDLAIKLSKNAREKARVTHSKMINIDSIINCYRDIYKQQT